jgi:Metallo-peptidase family M12
VKKFSSLLFLVLSLSSFGQGKSWFSSVTTNPDKLKSYARRSVTFQLDTLKSQAEYRANKASIYLSIPVPGGFKELEFESNDIHASGYRVLDSKGKDVSSTLQFPHHYKSISRKRGKEIAALSLFSNGQFVLVYSDSNGNLNVSQLPEKQGNPTEYVSFFDDDLTKKNPFHCGIDHDEIHPSHRSGNENTSITADTSCRLTEIYWECDFDMFQKGVTIQGTLNKFESMFNGTAILYEVETINIGVKAVKIWNTPDPYTYTTSFTALDDFMAAGNAANWPGQLAHLLSTRPLNLGGVAFLDAICSNIRYGFSDIDFTFTELPVYSWTLSTIAHELGHNFSSNHTHNCGWELSPGVFGQIDSCWNAEGNCQPTIKGREGTIMSYCHLTGYVNLSLGFGPLPGNRIRQGYANMPCVSGSIVIPNFTPTSTGPFCVGDSIQLLAEDLEGYSYKWTGPNGFLSNEKFPIIPNVTEQAEGKYSLSLKKSACESRGKKTDVIFNCLQVDALPNTICAGSNLSVPFHSTGEFNSGNQFIVQLSNTAGSFTSALNIDTITATIPGVFNSKLPSNLTTGTNYKVRIISTNPAYTGKPPVKNILINAVGPSPQPQDGERCGPGAVQISATGGSNLLWFENKTAPIPLANNVRKFTTPVINQTTGFYVQSGNVTKARSGLNSILAGINSSNTEDGLAFTVLSTIRLDSVTIPHATMSGSGNLCRIILQKNGVQWYQNDVVSTGNKAKVALFWRLDPGSGYVIKCENISQSLFTASVNWGSYPLKYPTLLNIEGALSAATTYPYVFNWVISKYSSCPSPRIEVKARILNGQTPETPLVNQISDSLVCNVAAPQYQWQVNGILQNNNNAPKIKGLQNSSYMVRYKLDSCWSEWSDPVVAVITEVSEPDQKEMVSVFPNPGKGFLNWTGPEEKTGIKLFSTEGKSVLEKEIFGAEPLDLRQLPAGLYILQWSTIQARGSILVSIE